jgi:hypothetical protein
MNERVKELERQCWQSIDSDPYALFDVKKFAELIVKECARVAWYHTPDTEELEYSHLIEDKILEHFGVEE